MGLSKDYLAGLIEGEGCFGIYENPYHNKRRKTILGYRPMFKLGLRDDDRIILEKIVHTLGIKNNLAKDDRNNTQKCSNWKPCCVLQLYNKDGLYKLIEYLGENPFVGKKREQYYIWCRAVKYFHENKKNHWKDKTQRDLFYKTLKKYHDLLRELKKYNGGNNGTN